MLLLLLLLKLLLKLLWDSRHWRSAGLERLLLRSSLAGEAGELWLKLARSLRLRLLQARVSGVLLLKGSLRLSVAGGLRSERTRLLLAGLLAGLAKGVSILLLGLGSRAETVASAEEGVGLGVHAVDVVQETMGGRGLADGVVAKVAGVADLASMTLERGAKRRETRCCKEQVRMLDDRALTWLAATPNHTAPRDAKLDKTEMVKGRGSK